MMPPPPPQMHAHMHVLRSLHARCMAVGRGAKPPLMCALVSLAFDIIAPHCPLRCAARICRAVVEAGNSAADMTAATAVKGLEGQVLQLTSQVWLKWAQGGLVLYNTYVADTERTTLSGACMRPLRVIE